MQAQHETTRHCCQIYMRVTNFEFRRLRKQIFQGSFGFPCFFCGASRRMSICIFYRATFRAFPLFRSAFKRPHAKSVVVIFLKAFRARLGAGGKVTSVVYTEEDNFGTPSLKRRSSASNLADRNFRCQFHDNRLRWFAVLIIFAARQERAAVNCFRH